MTLQTYLDLVHSAGIGLADLGRLHRACLSGLAEDRANAVFYRLFADLIQRFIDRYDDGPLPESAARKALGTLGELAIQAAAASKAQPQERLQAIDKVAVAEL